MHQHWPINSDHFIRVMYYVNSNGNWAQDIWEQDIQKLFALCLQYFGNPKVFYNKKFIKHACVYGYIIYVCI